MSKVVTIKLTSSAANVGPFIITDEYENVLATDVSKQSLIDGVSYSVNNEVSL
jgi:hypothetical protein